MGESPGLAALITRISMYSNVTNNVFTKGGVFQALIRHYQCEPTVVLCVFSDR